MDEPSATTIVEEVPQKKSRAKKAKDVSFARPPFAEELFSEPYKASFDKLPGQTRHFIKQLIQTGNIDLASKQSQLAVKEAPQEKPIKELMDQNGMSAADLVHALKDCIQAEGYIKDNHGKVFMGIDFKVRLKALELAHRLRGDLNPQKAPQKEGEAVDLFENTDPSATD